MATKGPNPVWISARKKLNQSRPRALAGAAAVTAAGAVRLRRGGDATSLPAKRSSRPPSNSSASVDRPWSPPPLGIHGVGHSAECPSAPDLPLIAPMHHAAHIPSPVSRSRPGSETANAAILRIHCDFHTNRYHGTTKFPFPTQMELFWRATTRLRRSESESAPVNQYRHRFRVGSSWPQPYLRSRIAAIALT